MDPSKEAQRKHDEKFFAVVSFLGAVVPLFTYIICYLTAFKLGHFSNNARLPFFTQLGEKKPESVIFSVGLCISSLLHITVVYARYLQVLTFRFPPCPQSNTIASYFGIAFIFGELLISTFRRYDTAWAHLLGKILHFACISMYIGIQAYISIHQRPDHRRLLAYFRLALAAMTVCCPFVFIVGFSFRKLHKLSIPQAAELSLILLITMFWMSLAVDFTYNPIEHIFHRDEYDYGIKNIRYRHSRGDNNRVIAYLGEPDETVNEGTANEQTANEETANVEAGNVEVTEVETANVHDVNVED